MFRLVESIRIENRQLQLIQLHNQRLNQARKALFHAKSQIQLEDFIIIPDNISDLRHKCRVTTTDGEHFEVEITPYQQRKIESLKLLVANHIQYEFKTDQRAELNKAYEQRGQCDDIIIVKNNLLTDSWAANIILFDGNKWVTPDVPLLKGVQRENLIRLEQIHCRKIEVQDLQCFQKIKLINALIDFDRAPEISLQLVIY